MLPALSGCGQVAHVSGVVVEDGQPYTPTEEMVALLCARDEPAMTISVTVQPDGSFTVYGPNNEGLPPGKYRVGYYSDVEGGRKKRIKNLPAESSSLELELGRGDRVRL